MCDCTCPRKIHIGPKAEAKMARAIKKVKFPPDVAWVRWRIGETWDGDTAMFYNIVLNKYEPERSLKVIRKVQNDLDDAADLAEVGIGSYLNTRSLEEMNRIEESLKKNPKGEFSSDYEQWKRI